MGCVASRLEEEEQVVSICKERKRLIKLAVERRYELAEAHCRYCQALYAVAAAIKLFVARHSSPSSPYLITFPPPCPSPPPTDQRNVITNPMFLQQRPSESTHEAITCESCQSSTTSTDSTEEETKEKEEEEEEEEEEKDQARVREQPEQGRGYFYMQMPPQMPSPHRDFGWDFFNPFDGVRPDILSSDRGSLDEDLRMVREEEGIPELEEEGEREEEEEEEDDEEEEEKEVVVEENSDKEHHEESRGEMLKGVDGCNVSHVEQKGFTMIDSPEEGRELLDALKDIEDHFVRAYDSGKDVSRMLEVNLVHLQSGLEEIKGNTAKLIWHRSIPLKPSSCKSLVASSSKSTSTWTEYRNDLFEDYGGMDSGSHSLTLGRLYAWEKKLYEEVKAGDTTRKIYEKKCSRLRNQDVEGYDELSINKTRAAVKDLYARILVAIRSAESISKRIQKLRDEELQPQIVELLKGLTRTWKIMLESHETQNKILFEVKSFACPTSGKFCNDSHRLATLQLEAELRNWCECFAEYFAAQKAYVQALYGWLNKFLLPDIEYYPRGRSSSVPFRANGPTLLVICHDWLASMERLPDRGVAFALQSFSKDVRALWYHQGEEQQQKRKVDGLAKELNRRTLAFQKAETRFLESKLMEQKSELEMETRNEYLTEKKNQLDTLRRKMEIEKEKHHNCMQETQRITLNGFQTGFSTVFESLTEFSKASLKMYKDLVTCRENADKAGNQSYIEDSQVQDRAKR